MVIMPNGTERLAWVLADDSSFATKSMVGLDSALVCVQAKAKVTTEATAAAD